MISKEEARSMYGKRRTQLANKHKQHEWDRYFLAMALLVASKSCDNSLKVGCVIVGPDNEVRSTGYNGFCRGCEPNEARLQRPAKYDWTEHAERNAVFNAARIGVSLKGCTAYVVCNDETRGGNAPCIQCARAFIQSGITTVIEWNSPTMSEDVPQETGTWRDGQDLSADMLREAGVELRLVPLEE